MSDVSRYWYFSISDNCGLLCMELLNRAMNEGHNVSSPANCGKEIFGNFIFEVCFSSTDAGAGADVYCLSI